MRWLEVNKSKPLRGKIKIPGAKNSSLGLLAAAALADEPVFLENIPNIQDYRVICEIGEEIGMPITEEDRQLRIDPTQLHSSVISPERASAFRASYYFIGALLAKFKKVTIGYPGGDQFGSRPIDQHIKGFEALGATCTFGPDHYTVEADQLVGANIYFDKISMGATINILLAAVKAQGKTVLHNAARDPEVVDVTLFLNKMGAKIRGAGTDRIVIEGVDYLQGATHTAIPDRLVAATFLVAAALTKGKITVEDIIPEHLSSCLAKLEEAGVTLEITDQTITSSVQNPLKAINIKTGMYPVFGTDYQQPFTTLLTQVKGVSLIDDPIFPERFDHCVQLNRMGAQIRIGEGQASIEGGVPLRGSWVHATDVRAGMCLVLAGLIAEGTTYITGVEHIERGYDDIVSMMRSLGADVTLREDEQMTMPTDSDSPQLISGK